MGFYERNYILIKLVVSMSCDSTLIANVCKQEMKVCTLTGIHCPVLARYPDTGSPFNSWVLCDIPQSLLELPQQHLQWIKPDVSGHPISTRSQSGSWVCLVLHLLNS